MTFELDNALDWKQQLREHRKARGFTQTRLAREANLSLSAVKQYETGQRHPSADALNALIAALGLTAEQSTPIRAGAGYAPDLKRIFYERLGPYEIRDLEAQANSYPWPSFVCNIATDILAVNRPFLRVLGPELERLFHTDGVYRNFISTATNPVFASRVRNWDESARFMMGLMKGETRWEHNLERPAPLLEGPTRRFLEGDPELILRTLSLFESATPVRHTTRIDSRFVWALEDDREITFKVLITIADLYQELSWNDWVPETAADWAVLESLV